MKRDFCRFIVAVTITLVGVAAIDICTGKAMESLLPKVDISCETGCLYYSLNEVEVPVLIVGSSRAHHHYVPKIITDSLGLGTYNLGSNGCFFNHNCCVINSILDRYQPKMIIWELAPQYLFEDIKDQVEILYPYYLTNAHIHSCIDSITRPIDRIPLYSNLYQYNSKPHRILIRAISGDAGDTGLNGYMPRAPKQWQPEENEKETSMPQVLSAYKEQQLVSVLTRIKSSGVRIVMIDSPYYSRENQDDAATVRIKEICDSLEVPFIDNTHLEGFYGNKELFTDNVHMNEIGAERYTKVFLDEIMQ